MDQYHSQSNIQHNLGQLNKNLVTRKWSRLLHVDEPLLPKFYLTQ